MNTRALTVITLLGSLFAPVAAARVQAQGEVPAPSKPVAAPPSPTANVAEPINIRLDLTISMMDAKGGLLLPAKTATLHVVHGDSGRIRMQNGTNDMLSYLNVDATPSLVDRERERIRVNVSLEYHPRPEEGNPTFTVNERLSAVVPSGKQMIVSQTTDPGADRQVRVELKATILK